MSAYEAASKLCLTKRLPVIIRVDGRAFHTYTRGCTKPFDITITDVMINVAMELCKQVQGAQMAYTQSDEVSVLVHSYKNLRTDPWYGNQVQKMVSVAAGIASSTFTSRALTAWEEGVWTGKRGIGPAVFDARAFVLPENDVCNYFIWRQKDAVKNSMQALAQSLFSSKELHGKCFESMREMCLSKGKDWNVLETGYKRGVAVRRVTHIKRHDSVDTVRFSWQPDSETPIFKDDRDYIECHLQMNER